METLIKDIRYGLRGLWKRPGFTVVALITLALGIGANTAIFSLINAVLIRPLPFSEPERLVFLWNTRGGSGGEPEPLGPGRMIDFRTQMTSFGAFAGISHLSYTVTGAGDPEQIQGSSVSSAFFDVLGVRPLAGDTF